MTMIFTNDYVFLEPFKLTFLYLCTNLAILSRDEKRTYRVILDIALFSNVATH